MSLFQVTKKQVIENYELRTMTGDIVSFTPSYSQLLPDPFSDLNVTVNVLATGGNGTPDNPNPINGYTEANITRCGVNLWDEEWELGRITNTGEKEYAVDRIVSKNYIRVAPSTEYYTYIGGYDITLYGCRRWAYDENFNSIGQIGSDYTVKFTTPANCKYILFSPNVQYGTSYLNNISINYPATETTYHAYNGNTYTIAFGQTVYGGVLDVTRGKLTVTHGYVDLGSIDWTKMNTESPHWRFRGYVKGMKPSASPVAIPNIICDIYRTSSASDSWIGVNNIIAVANDANAFFIVDERYTTAEDFTSAVSGHYAIYELATPFDIDLTPVQIRALVGENNVFADCGETTVTCLI